MMNEKLMKDVLSWMEELENNGESEKAEMLRNLLDKADTRVSTPFGTFFAEKSMDPDYPGIFITMKDPEGYQDAIALVEYHKEAERIRTIFWRGDEEDYVDTFTNYDEEIFQKRKESLNQE